SFSARNGAAYTLWARAMSSPTAKGLFQEIHFSKGQTMISALGEGARHAVFDRLDEIAPEGPLRGLYQHLGRHAGGRRETRYPGKFLRWQLDAGEIRFLLHAAFGRQGVCGNVEDLAIEDRCRTA